MIKKIKLLISFLMVFMTITLVGCGKGAEINGINDFSKFSSMKEETDKIEVEYDNNSGQSFDFTIENSEDIDCIMDIIFSSTFINKGDEMYAGDNTNIVIIQGENEYRMNVRMNKEGKNYYAFSNSDLQNKISEIARSKGAYDNVE